MEGEEDDDGFSRTIPSISGNKSIEAPPIYDASGQSADTDASRARKNSYLPFDFDETVENEGTIADHTKKLGLFDQIQNHVWQERQEGGRDSPIGQSREEDVEEAEVGLESPKFASGGNDHSGARFSFDEKVPIIPQSEITQCSIGGTLDATTLDVGNFSALYQNSNSGSSSSSSSSSGGSRSNNSKSDTVSTSSASSISVGGGLSIAPSRAPSGGNVRTESVLERIGSFLSTALHRDPLAQKQLALSEAAPATEGNSVEVTKLLTPAELVPAPSSSTDEKRPDDNDGGIGVKERIPIEDIQSGIEANKDDANAKSIVEQISSVFGFNLRSHEGASGTT